MVAVIDADVKIRGLLSSFTVTDAELKFRALLSLPRIPVGTAAAGLVTMSPRRPPRLRGFNYVGQHGYFVTCCTASRQQAFVDEASVDCVRTQMLRTCSDKDFEEIASVFMPDHLHVLLRGTSTSSAFLPFMKLMRQRTAMFYRRLTGESLWQQGYFDRVLRPDDDLTRITRYMMENPVRAGLIGKPEDYPFSYLQLSPCGR